MFGSCFSWAIVAISWSRWSFVIRPAVAASRIFDSTSLSRQRSTSTRLEKSSLVIVWPFTVATASQWLEYQFTPAATARMSSENTTTAPKARFV